MRQVLALLAATTCVAVPASAQVVLNEELPLQTRSEDLPIRFESVTLEDGLSQSSVYSIAQDPKGFMWFGTQSGLNRYDGTRVEVFRPDAFDSTSVLNRWIWDIEVDERGFLWLGYAGGSVGRFDPATGRSRNYLAAAGDSTRLVPGTAYDVVVDGGVVWVLTADGGPAGIQRLDPETGRVTRYGSRLWPGGQGSGAFRLLLGADGLRYVFASDGVYRFDPASEGIEKVTGARVSLPHPDPDDPMAVWVGSNDGAGRLDLETGEMRLYDVTLGDVDWVIEAVPDPTEPGIVWVSTREGLARLDEASGAFRQYRSNRGDPNSILGNFAARVFADRSGIVWVSVAGAGVSRFDPTAIGFGKESERSGSADAMRGSSMWGIHVAQNPVLWVLAVGSDHSDPVWYLNRIDRASGRVRSWKTNSGGTTNVLVDRRGTVYVGSRPATWETDFEGGVWRYDPARATLVPAFTAANGALPNDVVFTLAEARDGSLWIGTNGGIVRVDPETGEPAVWTADPDDPSRLADGRIRHILEDSRGDVWVSSPSALARIRGGRGPVERMDARPDAAALSGAYPRLPAEDAGGDVWWIAQPAAGATSVVRYDAGADRFVAYPHDPSDRGSWTGVTASGIVAEPGHADRLWFTSYGGGLSRLDLESGRFRHYGPADGLTNLDAYLPVFDNEGALWIPTNSGLFRFDPETERFQRFGLEYGLQSLEFNAGSVARSASGELFFGGVGGFNAFFPSQLRSNEVPPQVALTELLLFNERVTPGPDSPLKEGIADAKEIRLRHDQNAPTIRFAALHYKRPEANTVRYRLEPLQAEWIDAGGVNEASYTNLEPGEYTFRVVAANSDGVWNEEGASLRLVVLAPWWRTWWAYVAYAALLAGAVFAVDRTMRARIARRQREHARERELEHAKEIETAYHQLRQTKEQLVQQEKLASLGSLTAGIAHEIKNPLNFVNNFAEVNAELAEEVAEAVSRGDTAAARALLADLRGNAEQIAKHGRRADSIVRSMMQHARGEAAQRESVDLNEFVDEYANLAWHGLRARAHGFTVDVERDLDPAAGTVSVQPQEIGRVVLNLLNNAFQAVQEKAEFAGGTFTPKVRVATRRNGRSVEVRVTDNGPGVPEHLREKVFEPFFTTKSTGEGTGLGLSLSHEIVSGGHGGTLTVREAEEGGAEFVMTLPA